MRPVRTVSRVAVALAVGALLLGLPAPVTASSGPPGTPSGIHAVNVTATSFTAVVGTHSNTTTYRVHVSGTKSNVYVSNIAAARHVTSSSPSITVSGLQYWTKPYWYRVEAINGSSRRWSDIHYVSLRPDTPTGVAVHTTSTGTWLTWDAGSCTAFQIIRATDPGLTQDRVVYTSRSALHQFSPYPLTAGKTYYYAVRSRNGTTNSAFSPVVSAVAGSSLDGVRVLSYNILNTRRDGTKAGDGVIGSWSQRAPGIVALIRSADPDVIAFQEGGGWVGDPSAKTRQVDDLERRLGGDYKLIRTEVPPTEPYYFRTGSYVMIKRASLAAVGAGDHWDIGGTARVGAYVELQSLQTGAKFLFVATHLSSSAAGDPDAERAAEMTTLVNKATAEAAARGDLPVVIGGDFNSHPTPDQPNDSVTVVSRQALFSDAITTAQTVNDTKYNSANKYLRTPPAAGVSVDRVFTSPGVAVVGFRVVLHLVNGKFSGVIPSDHNPVVTAVSIPY